jgi:glucokinase
MVGRPPVVLGLDFGGTKIAVAVCDLQGNRLASATVSAAAAPDDSRAPRGAHGHARTVFERGIRAARGLLVTAAPDRRLVAVGASTFGIPYDDRVELAPAIDGWEELELGRELREAFGGAAVQMATDAKAAAAAEQRWGALHGCDPGVYLNLGTGLSAAIVAGGKVIDGGNGAAGEFGYNLRSASDVGLDLSQRTMLEEMVSGLALARRATGQPGRPAELTAADVFGAGSADPELSRLVEEFTSELAFHLVNLAILVNPVRIAVGGGLVRSWDRIAPVLQAALRIGPPFPPELVVGRFPYDAPLLGAVAVAIDAVGGGPGTTGGGGTGGAAGPYGQADQADQAGEDADLGDDLDGSDPLAEPALAPVSADGSNISEISDTTDVSEAAAATGITLHDNTGAKA